MLATFLPRLLAAGALLFATASWAALQPLEDESLSESTGEGLALGTYNFRALSGPTSFWEATGTEPPAASGWKRADARYYGISYSGQTPASTWAGTCNAGIMNMGCPIGGLVQYFWPFDNPMVIRVFDYTARNYLGSNVTRTVFELLHPTNQDPYKFSMWTELIVDKNSVYGAPSRHQGQMILSNTKLSNKSHNPALPTTRNNSKIRIFGHTDPGDPTIAFIWENNYQGDFRYSVNQKLASPDAEGSPPRFDNNEGFYAANIRTYFPMGQLFYQATILDTSPAYDGNFVIEQTRIPAYVNVYSDFYSLAGADNRYIGYQRTGRPNRYYETHAFFNVGSTGTVNNSGTTGAFGTKTRDATDGVFFVKGAASPTFTAYAARPNLTGGAAPGCCQSYSYAGMSRVNIGDIFIDGILVQHMKITTCSAGGAAAC